jgi:hypothetical protein
MAVNHILIIEHMKLENMALESFQSGSEPL